MDHNKASGAYIGAAIGDAMGGPVECSHAARIRRTAGEITGLLPYNGDYSILKAPTPGYALRADAGAVTDDTFIRADLTRYYIEHDGPRTPATLAEWLLTNADFTMWWRPAVRALKRVKRGRVTAETGGMTHTPGGGVGWWTPVGIVNAGDPKRAFDEAKRMCTVWKDPLEQDLLAAVQAGVAAGMTVGATADNVIDAILKYSGSLARMLLQRSLDIVHMVKNREELIERLYSTVLINRHPRWDSKELPPLQEAPPDTDLPCTSPLFCEQIPLALAAFVFADGIPSDAIPLTVMIGRDCDTTATTVGSWCGALHGESGLPEEWVETVCRINKPEIDIKDLVERLIARYGGE